VLLHVRRQRDERRHRQRHRQDAVLLDRRQDRPKEAVRLTACGSGRPSSKRRARAGWPHP
jgi:hypothetical protein